MEPLPHHYRVRIAGGAAGSVDASAAGLPTLSLAPPPSFGGPGDRWSPEELLVESVASCFLFTFRSVASASKIIFSRVECDADGILDRLVHNAHRLEMKGESMRKKRSAAS